MLIDRYFTGEEDTMDKVLDRAAWKSQDLDIPNTGSVSVEFPAHWVNDDAKAIVAAKYFKVIDGVPERSLRQVIERVVRTIVGWGQEHGYYRIYEDSKILGAELAYILLYQKACFNSPVLFNVGVPGRTQQVSACFLTAVGDDLDSIQNHYMVEGQIFKGGSGSGVNVSSLRPKDAPLSTGGVSSGPLSFMKGWDASANAIKSGGTTRRAAKMVIMNADHPDVVEFIDSKPAEELKAQALVSAGYDDGIDGAARDTVAFQNANHSVLVSDEFMQRATTESDSEEASILRRIAEAAWSCGDPGLIYDGALNKFHTTKKDGRIDTVNPCSEFHHQHWTSCNLSSIDLAKLGRHQGDSHHRFETDLDSQYMKDLEQVVRVMATAQDICISGGEYPLDRIREATLDYRPIGIGFSNLGSLLIRNGTPYDSKGGRDTASYVAGWMAYFAWSQSARMARMKGPFPRWNQNAEQMQAHLLRQANQTAFEGVPRLRNAWKGMVAESAAYGFRNSYVTNIAPVGTISFMMDNDTTGVEPEIALTRTKVLVGGGSITTTSKAIEAKLTSLHGRAVAGDIMKNIVENGTVCKSNLIGEHLRQVFLTALPDSEGNALSPEAHLNMLAAVQPFLSGGISKTVNCPEDYTVEDIMSLYEQAWQLGLKSLAIYRDNSKVVQPVTQTTEQKYEPEPVLDVGGRHRLPATTNARRHKFRVGEMEGFIHAGEYDDGRLGEIFLTIGHQGSTFDGIMDSFATAVSLYLQMGGSVDVICSKMIGRSFEPHGFTDNKDIKTAASIVDYVFQWLQMEYGEARQEVAVDALNSFFADVEVEPNTATQHTGKICSTCGGQMVQTGTCLTCVKCGDSFGGCG